MGIHPLRSASRGQRVVSVAVVVAVLPHRVEPRPDSVKLLGHYASGRPADAVLPDNIRPYERSAYADSQHARLGAGHNVCQPTALLHRNIARPLPERQHADRPPAATALDGGLRRGVVGWRDT